MLICYPPVWLSPTGEEGDEKVNSLRTEGKKKKKKKVLVRFCLNSLLIQISKGWCPGQLLLLSKQGLELLQSSCRDLFAGACPAPCLWEGAHSQCLTVTGSLLFKQVQVSQPGSATP